MGNSDRGGTFGVLVGIGNSERGGTFGVLVGIGNSERGGTLGVLNGRFDEAGFTVVVLMVTVDFTVVGVTLANDFFVVVGSAVVVSLSFDFPLKNPVIPLKNPFFFVVASGASVVVVVVVVVGRATGGNRL